MASLLPGYEFDIFISYRQKDNKGERWISEFVESLKTELELMFLLLYGSCLHCTMLQYTQIQIIMLL